MCVSSSVLFYPHRSCSRLLNAVLVVLWAPLAYAHGDAASAARTAAETWPAAALMIAGLFYAHGLYRLARSARSHPTYVIRCGVMFALGWFALTVAFASPFIASTRAVFSAHMVQHELLMVVGAPLMVLGRPLAIWTWALPRNWRPAVARTFREKKVRTVWRFMSAPVAASVVHAGAIWVWHVPVLFERAEVSLAVHTLQHCAFLFSALLLWWAVLKPRDQHSLAAVLCLFMTMVHTGALGVLLTFSGDVWYPLSTSGAAHWGLTPIEDQQLGGLIMWVPGGVPYVVAALMLAARWLSSHHAAPSDSRDLTPRPQSS
jgi:putative membrane protein